ncbi:ATP-binding protein [Streptosporangium sp. NPDC002721]|uniref:ATP-binding protein n=1 Tax=Streptosporangium sp. NPDC002721 TaxID=3366188 RepID=UPI0036C39DA5
MGEIMETASPEPKVIGSIDLPSVRESVSRARSEVRKWLGVNHPAIDDVLLAVSELVTNSIKHSDSKVGDFIGLTVAATDEIIYVEVNDPGSMFSGPHVRKEMDAEDGRGLLIVREISLEWGTREHGHGLGRTVWCAVRATPLPENPPIPKSVSG